MAAWFVLVETISADLQEARDAARKQEWSEAKDALGAMAASLNMARDALREAELSRDRTLANFATALGAEYARMIFFAHRFEDTAEPGVAFEEELELLLAAAAFDERGFGRWLRATCPGLADEALRSLDDLRPVAGPQ